MSKTFFEVIIPSGALKGFNYSFVLMEFLKKINNHSGKDQFDIKIIDSFFAASIGSFVLSFVTDKNFHGSYDELQKKIDKAMLAFFDLNILDVALSAFDKTYQVHRSARKNANPIHFSEKKNNILFYDLINQKFSTVKFEQNTNLREDISIPYQLNFTEAIQASTATNYPYQVKKNNKKNLFCDSGAFAECFFYTKTIAKEKDANNFVFFNQIYKDAPTVPAKISEIARDLSSSFQKSSIQDKSKITAILYKKLFQRIKKKVLIILYNHSFLINGSFDVRLSSFGEMTKKSRQFIKNNNEFFQKAADAVKKMLNSDASQEVKTITADNGPANPNHTIQMDFMT